MLSHDDESPAMRQAFRAQGVGIAEFPVNEETAREAADGGDFIVFGAPNVVRGGSHTGWTKAADMIAKGLCSILASDYYYPAQLLAAFRLAADGVLPLAASLGSDFGGAGPGRRPRRSRRFSRQGSRADIILVDDEVPLRPRIVAVIAAGRLVHLTEASRLLASASRADARRLQRRDAGSILRCHGRTIPATRSTMPPAPGSALDRFGADLLGYDAFSGEDAAVSRRHRAKAAGLARAHARIRANTAFMPR